MTSSSYSSWLKFDSPIFDLCSHELEFMGAYDWGYLFFVKTEQGVLFSKADGYSLESGLFPMLLKKYSDFNDFCKLCVLEMPYRAADEFKKYTFGRTEIDLLERPPEHPNAACYLNSLTQEIYIYQRGEASGEREILPLHRVMIKLLPHFWPEWTIHTAQRGYIEILERVGFQNTSIPNTMQDLPLDALYVFYSRIFEFFVPYEIQSQETDSFEAYIQETVELICKGSSEEYKNYTKFVFTLIRNQNSIDYVIPDLFGKGFYLSCSRRLFDYLDQLPQIELSHEKHGENAGMIINLDEKKVCYWIEGGVEPVIEDQMKKIWSGWDVSWHIKGLPYQFHLTGRDPRPLMMPYEEVWQNMKGYLGGERFEDWLSREEYYELWDTI